MLFAVLFRFAAAETDVFAQPSISRVSRIVKTEPVAAKTSAAENSRFAAASLLNARLRNDLKWQFGGKAQSGWDLYVPLIWQTIGTEAEADGVEFAAALSAWQLRSGLSGTGVLDDQTLRAFVKHWQSRRLGRSTVPGPERLLSAPIADFFDPTRDANLLQLERETYDAYNRMIAAAARDLSGTVRFTRSGQLAPGEKYLRIVSAFRSPEYQAMLRRKEPGAGRGALARFSAHSTGQALDLYVGGEPVTTKDFNRAVQVRTPAYRWLVKNAHKFGFVPYFYEPWHWEYVGVR